MRLALHAWQGVALISAASVSTSIHAAPVGEAEVRQCAQEIFQRAAGGQCARGFSLESVKKVDARQTSSEAFVIADIDFRVKQQVGGTSQGTRQCTGTGWRGEVKNPYPSNTGQWFMFQSQADMDGGYLEPGRGLRIRKKFKFEHWESGWRCAEAEMGPIDQTWFINAPAPSTAPLGSVNAPAAGGQVACKVFLFNDTISLASPYTGGCKDGLAEGHGRYSYASRNSSAITVVNGEFHEGKLNGRVTQDRPGMHFEGEFQDNRLIRSSVNGQPMTVR